MTQPNQTNDSGAQQPAGAQQPTAQQHQQKAQAWAASLTKMAPASIRKTWVGALALCAALLLIVTLVFSGGNTPENVAPAFFKAINTGEVDKAIALVHFPANFSPADKGQLIAGVKEVFDSEGLVRVEVLSSKIDSANPDRARVKIRSHLKDGRQKTEEMPLVRVKGKWMVALAGALGE